jgi:hypothetical protein
VEFLAAKDPRVSEKPWDLDPFRQPYFHLAMTEFIPNSEIYNLPPSGNPPNPEPADPREPVRVMLIGTASGMGLVIAHLHRLGFAEPRAWSEPQLDPTTGQPIRILTKWIRH